MDESDNSPKPSGHDLSPPDGYESWLVYAVATFDSRSAILHTIFDDTASLSREQVETAVWAEFNELRIRAGLAPINPQSTQQG